MRYLILYDIVSSRRIYRIVKILNCFLVCRIQKSLYEVLLTESEKQKLVEDVTKVLDSDADKFAIIPLCETDWQKREQFGIVVSSFLPPSEYLIL